MDEAGAEPGSLTDYAAAAMGRLEAAPLDTLLQGDASWPTI
jgi:hypothetical protein